MGGIGVRACLRGFRELPRPRRHSRRRQWPSSKPVRQRSNIWVLHFSTPKAHSSYLKSIQAQIFKGKKSGSRDLSVPPPGWRESNPSTGSGRHKPSPVPRLVGRQSPAPRVAVKSSRFVHISRNVDDSIPMKSKSESLLQFRLL